GTHLLNKILEEEFDNTVVNFLRLSRTDFEYLLSLISPMIGKQDKNMRESISARERFKITLRFLATGDNDKSLEYKTKRNQFRYSSQSDEWIQISESFQEQLKFPHAIGTIDGRHIPIKAPCLSGSDYINYKKFFSIVLLAVVDANCNFIFADVGSKGRIAEC
uniref:DDE Tnp4 domain-containing protein n=1 Tax=Anopheles dirus TaxID=7168 RepID=A0A182NT40_9DIPT